MYQKIKIKIHFNKSWTFLTLAILQVKLACKLLFWHYNSRTIILREKQSTFHMFVIH
jgi:hypothetical protein